MYSERNNKNRFKKLRSKAYVIEKQENDKNTDNNKKIKNFLKVKNHKFNYYVTD